MHSFMLLKEINQQRAQKISKNDQIFLKEPFIFARRFKSYFNLSALCLLSCGYRKPRLANSERPHYNVYLVPTAPCQLRQPDFVASMASHDTSGALGSVLAYTDCTAKKKARSPKNVLILV